MKQYESVCKRNETTSEKEEPRVLDLSSKLDSKNDKQTIHEQNLIVNNENNKSVLYEHEKPKFSHNISQLI